MAQVYKVYNFVTDRIDVVARVNENKHEIIEALDVPEGEDPRDYLEVLRNEVHLGDSCESATRFNQGRRY